MKNIRDVANTPVPAPQRPPILFDISPASLAANTALITSFDFDFEALLADNQDTTIGYNSEFRPVSQLKEILGDHPNFEFFERVAKEGMDYKFTSDIREVDRRRKSTGYFEGGTTSRRWRTHSRPKPCSPKT
jgi:hypothetical protein